VLDASPLSMQHIAAILMTGWLWEKCTCKDYKIDICYFSAQNAPSRNNSKDWMANMYKWRDMCNFKLLFYWVSTIKNPAQHVGLAWSKNHQYYQKFNCFPHDKVEKLVLSNKMKKNNATVFEHF
jgi:hypothetical protein